MSKLTKVLVALLLVLVLALAGLLGYWFLSNHVIIDWKAYPKDAEYLNLTKRDITVEHYEAVQAALPDCEIDWNVPFQGKTYPLHTQTVAFSSITPEEVEALQYLPHLKKIDATGCTDFDQLATLKATHPDCEFVYSVLVDGKTYGQETTELTLANLTESDVAMLAHLPNLVSINADGCTDYEELAALRENHPELDIYYTVILNDLHVETDTPELTLEDMDPASVLDLLVHLPELKKLHLVDPTGEAASLQALQETYPDMTITWELVRDGVTITSDAQEVDLSHVTLNSIEEVERIMDYAPDAKQVYLGMPNIDNDTIAAFREAKRQDYKVVWTVMCGSLDVRTDDTYFHPTGRGVFYFYDEDCVNLKYCEDMICVDVGHMSITHCSWVENMPNLKYLILGCCGNLKDISALETCKNLVFLELYLTSVRDLTPVLGCTALEDFNLGFCSGDPAVVAQMTWLKNLWWSGCSGSGRALLTQSLPDTFLMFAATNSTSKGWRRLDNYYAMRDSMNAKYMD